jgi:hypothetical protein
MRTAHIGESTSQSDLLDLRRITAIRLRRYGDSQLPSRLEFHQCGESWGSFAQFMDAIGKPVALTVPAADEGEPVTLILPPAVQCNKVVIIADRPCAADLQAV